MNFGQEARSMLRINMTRTAFRITTKNFIMTSALFFAGTIASSLAYTPLANAFGVGVQPSTVEMSIKPGDRHRQVVTLGNVHKTKTISLTIGLADWSLDKNGQLILNPPGETDRSAADWIRFSPASVTLKPETSRDIIVEIDVPYKTEGIGDHRFALLATTLLPELDSRGEVSGVWNKYQLASLFYLTLMPSVSTPEITNVALNEANGNMLTMSIKNDGDAHARLKGTATVKDKAGEVVGELPLSTVVLDRSERDYGIDLTNLDNLTAGQEYDIDFEFRNSYVPQNKFRTTIIPVDSVSFRAP
jgi:P pilus assembly chaperone PapD